MLSCFRNECYYEKPYAGKPHVRICEGLVSRGISLLDWGRSIGVDNRYVECGLWNTQKTDKCPECSEITDLRMEGLCLSWKCRRWDYAIATTANKLCFWDNGNFSEEYKNKSIQ